MKKLSAIFLFCFLSSSMPASDLNFTGIWNTNWGVLEIIQEGNAVTGNYGGNNPGTIKGTANGKRLDYQWIGENGESGFGYFELAEDGNSISGEWGAGNDNSGGGIWSGTRQ